MTVEVVVPSDFAEGTLPRKALEKYIEWQNLWFAHSSTTEWPIPPVTVTDYFKYDETKMIGTIDYHWYRPRHVFVFSAGNGDEGGAAVLFVECDDEDVLAIFQQFDSSYSLIYDTYDGPTFHTTPDKER